MSIYLLILFTVGTGFHFKATKNLAQMCEIQEKVKTNKLIIRVTLPEPQCVAKEAPFTGNLSLALPTCEATLGSKIGITSVKCEKFQPPPAWRERGAPATMWKEVGDAPPSPQPKTD